jgi:hypothetical protein
MARTEIRAPFLLVQIQLNIIVNLTNIDEEKKFDKIFDKYFGFIDDEYMVTVVNIIGNAGKIWTYWKKYTTDQSTITEPVYVLSQQPSEVV